MNKILLAKELIRIANMIVAYKEPYEVNYILKYLLKDMKFESTKSFISYVEKETEWKFQKLGSNELNVHFLMFDRDKNKFRLEVKLKRVKDYMEVLSYDFV